MKIEKVSLGDFEQELRRVKQVVGRRRARSVMQRDYYEIQLSIKELKRHKGYTGPIIYLQRDGLWYIQLIKWNVEISAFETETKAWQWASRYLGRQH